MPSKDSFAVLCNYKNARLVTVVTDRVHRKSL